MLAASAVLGADGPFARHLQNFRPRAEQQQMADAIATAVGSELHLVCEAPTGTGKTFAYLVPALLSGRRVVIATGTKALQDQLIESDFPVVQKALGWVGQARVLKGRANYLCLHRLAQTESRGLLSRSDAHQLVEIRRWASTTREGDTAEVSAIEESAPVWRAVTSTVDNCLGAQCAFYDDCYVLRARRRALEADIVVINHHLLFADLALREQGFGELLPQADTIIVDEAHQLPEIATQFFGSALGSRQIERLADDGLSAYHADAGDMPEAETRLRALRAAALAMREQFPRGEGRIAANRLRNRRSFALAVETLGRAIAEAVEVLALLSTRGTELGTCHRRAVDIATRFRNLLDADSTDVVAWIEYRSRSFTWHLSPLDVSGVFREHVDSHNAGWVFVSATLQVRGNFDFFTRRLGIGDAVVEAWESPFDYAQQALCYLPGDLPDPRDDGYVAALIERTRPIIERTDGCAFLLFTSYRALRQAETYLQRHQSDFTLLCQGDQPRAELLRRFRSSHRALLLGTSSFWQGVDVRGDALRCVVIDKLPFESPGDPVLQARVAHLKSLGRQPFSEYQLPRAVIALRQGVGRLIRDPSDYGVLVLGDPRLVDKGYGKIFLASLPPMPTTRSVDDVLQFLGRHDESPRG
ncbi:MAG: ATP-dependent DNA helicase [Pseudomonadota bacterium]